MIPMRSSKILVLTKTSLCVALLCVSAFIVIPIPFTPIMITAQTLVVTLIALLLKPSQSAAAVGVYLLLGICGIPVFSGGTAGIGQLLGPTGGFLWGFLAAAPLISWLKGKNNRFLRYLWVSVLVGIPVIDLFGTVFFCFTQHVDPWAALMATVVPFLVGDICKCIAASLLAVPLNHALRHQEATLC